MNQLFRSRSAYVGMGLVLGLVIGLEPRRPLAQRCRCTPRPRTASISSPSRRALSMTGVEALYFLDFLTGDMRAAVINPKTGKFNSFFTRNIASDFGGAGRNSGYLMVTGSVNMPRGTQQLSICR